MTEEGKTEQEIYGSEFSLEEGGWRNLGDNDHQYEALFIYFGEEFEIRFQATYLNGSISVYDLSTRGRVMILDDNINVEWGGSSNPEDDYDE
ncbi:hypothetical protein [Giesbergeria sinuosa]|uniref:hypothetical protein n=1 Tax=Giesbergeria sinuosa TaxID=80883 RepID=UPI0036D26A08